jgi:hypothetical protein
VQRRRRLPAAVRAWSSPPASPQPEQQGGGAARLQWSRKARVRGAGDCGMDRGKVWQRRAPNSNGELGRTGRSRCVAARGRLPFLRRHAHPPRDQRTAEDAHGNSRAGRRGRDRRSMACSYGGSVFRGVPGVRGVGRRATTSGRRGLPSTTFVKVV